MRSPVLVAAILSLSLLVTSGAVALESETTYGPPYEAGPQGGGTGSYANANAADGRIIAGRVYPAPGPLNCPAGGTFAKLEVQHTIGTPVTGVAATFSDAAVDPYTFVTLAVRDADGEWLASIRDRGPLLQDGQLEAPLFGESPKAGEVITVQFGIEVASACPHANGGTARFTEIRVF